MLPFKASWKGALKTLHLTNAWHESSGGVATFYRALIEAAGKRKHSIRLVVPAERDRIEEIGEFARIFHVQAPRAFLNSSYRIIYPSQYLWPGSKLQQILAAERPDVVEICDKYTLNYLGAVLRMNLLKDVDFRPAVVGMSCERMDDNFRVYLGGVPLARTFCKLYMKWLYFPFFDHHIANSEYTAEELRAASRGQLIHRATWIRSMGVDLTDLSPERKSPEARQQLIQAFGVPDDASLLLYVGRLVPEKNLKLLFDMMERLKVSSSRKLHLIVAGDGIERSQWEEFSNRRLTNLVTFSGHLRDKRRLADLYANCDVFIHPNPREPFGIAPLEAMASGLPLVVPNQGGVSSYASPDNSWTVESDPAHFAEAVEEVLSHETLRRQKTERALATVQTFRWENVASSFLDLYGDLAQMQIQQNASRPAPDFSSTPAKGFQAALMRTISKAAENVFRLTSGMAARRTVSPRSTLNIQ
jgi:alpha-1,6-mannosyltransferase